MKKNVQIGFAIALFALSIISTVWHNDLIGHIIYAVIIPSFVLSIVSFVTEISEKCEEKADKARKDHEKISELSDKIVDAEMMLYKEGLRGEYIEGEIPEEVYNTICKYKEDSSENLGKALTNSMIVIFCLRLNKVCQKIITIGYTLLFISLFLSPYISGWLSVIDLNCITLWSLTLLYLTLELKTNICDSIYSILLKKFSKRYEKIKEKADLER